MTEFSHGQHPITPPPELVMQWVSLACDSEGPETWIDLATQAARWGADMELEACKEWVSWRHSRHESDELLFARRPKPPSLKEQALIHFESFAATFETSGGDSDLIRRALEALPD